MAEKITDWKKLKTEYVKTDISARALANKYNTPYSTIRGHMEREGWAQERAQFKRTARKKALDAMATAAARKAERFKSMSDKMAIRLDKAIEECSGEPKDIASLMGSLRQLQIIEGFDRSKLDDEEQIARIAALRAKAEAKAPALEAIEIVGLPEEYKR